MQNRTTIAGGAQSFDAGYYCADESRCELCGAHLTADGIDHLKAVERDPGTAIRRLAHLHHDHPFVCRLLLMLVCNPVMKRREMQLELDCSAGFVNRHLKKLRELFPDLDALAGFKLKKSIDQNRRRERDRRIRRAKE